MENSSEIKISSKNDVAEYGDLYAQASNPLTSRAKIYSNSLSDYSQTLTRSGYDRDISEIVEIVRVLNNMAPLSMPEYNFNIDEINGERFYKPDGTLLLVREYDSDLIRDYYNSTDKEAKYSVSRILEHDKNTGRLKAKIEPISRNGSRLTTSIAIFDEKINNKYIIIQLSEGGVVNNISEFSGKGKSFQTLFRNVETFKPARYLEGRENIKNGFEMVDCLFNNSGEVVRIKRYSNKREVNIDYTDNKKNITVKTKQ